MLCDFYNDHTEYQENLLAKYYTKHGHRVTIIASTYISPFDYINELSNKHLNEELVVANGYKVYKRKYSLNIFNKLRRLRGVYTILQDESPDLIFVHDIHLNLSDAVKFKKSINRNCKIILDYHCDFSNSAKNWVSLILLHKVIRKSFLHFFLKYIDRIFYITPSSGHFLEKVYQVPYNMMSLLPLGGDIDMANFMREVEKRSEIRRRHSLLESDIILLTGGRLNPKKKTELLIEAFEHVRNTNCYLFIIGDFDECYPDYLDFLKYQIFNNNKIKFIGWLSKLEVYEYLAAVDLAIFPASQSILWQQSLVSGIPLIVGNDEIQDISYLNSYGAIDILDSSSMTADHLYEKLITYLNNPVKLKDSKNKASKTADEFLNYNKLILKTVNQN